jgi:hypothetical protein
MPRHASLAKAGLQLRTKMISKKMMKTRVVIII